MRVTRLCTNHPDLTYKDLNLGELFRFMGSYKVCITTMGKDAVRGYVVLEYGEYKEIKNLDSIVFRVTSVKID